MNRQQRNRDRRGPAGRGQRQAPALAYPLLPKTIAAWQAYIGRAPQNPGLVFDRFAPYAWRSEEGEPKEPQNPGLVFDRFAPDWGKQARVRLNGREMTAKEAGLRQVSEAAAKADQDLLNAWNERWQKLVAAAGAQPFSLWTDWRLVVGLGRDSAYEVGFTFHRYGFPILPGSSLKGLARVRGLVAVAEKVAPRSNAEPAEVNLGELEKILSTEKTEDFKRQFNDKYIAVEEDALKAGHDFRAIFGTTAFAGHAVFFDAIPARPPTLELDIMNPHYPLYYQGKEAPADWQSPNPVYFLTVAPGMEFHFAVGWRGSLGGTGKALQEQAVAWLKAGLRELGAGGKTSASYGYFTDQRPRARHEPAPAVQPVPQQPSPPAPQRSMRIQSSPPTRAAPTRLVPPAVSPQQSAPSSSLPEPAEGGTWRTGTVIEFQSQLARGEIVDDETGERLRITREMFVDRAWTPGRNQKVEYLVTKQDGGSVVVRVRRLGQQS